MLLLRAAVADARQRERRAILYAILSGVRCEAALRDNTGCSCATCFWADEAPTCASGEYCPPPPLPQPPPGCIGGMCAGVLGVPCMDCGVASGGNKTACRQCMREQIGAPELGGQCDFMANTLCNPDNC